MKHLAAEPKADHNARLVKKFYPPCKNI